MIFDRIENINNYGIDFKLIQNDLAKDVFTKGRYDLDSEHFAIGLEYTTKPGEEGLWEAHRIYLDIHIISEGEEIISIADLKNSKSTKDYEEDYELFEATPEHKIHLKPGYFLILYPHEVHRTSEKVNEAVDLKKRVYKYPIK